MDDAIRLVTAAARLRPPDVQAVLRDTVRMLMGVTS